MKQLRVALFLLVLSVLAACQNESVVDTNPEASASAATPGSGILDPQKGAAYTGYIIGNDGKTPVQIRYQVVEGYAVYDGDIGIGKASDVAQTADEALEKNAGGLSPQSLHTTGASYWADTGGVIPVSREYNPPNLQAAFNQIQQQVPGIKFVNYTGQQHYLVVRQYAVRGGEYKGCVGGVCSIEVSNNASTAIIMHELGHALGFQHEHQRCDRDSYLIMRDQSAAPSQFQKNCNWKMLGAYDYTSIMHYNSQEFGALHFTDRNGNLVEGYRDNPYLSSTDVTEWKKLYPGGTTNPNPGTTVPGTTVNTGSYTGPYNLRSGPGTNFGVTGSIGGGVAVSIVCQSSGTTHTGPYGSTSLWDKLSSGQWISDAYVYTGSNGSVAPPCS